MAVLVLTFSLIAGCGTNKLSSSSEPKDQTIYIVQTPPGNMLEQLKNNEIDGFVAWEPFNANAFINNPANLQKVQQYAAEFTSKPLEVVTKALP